MVGGLARCRRGTLWGPMGELLDTGLHALIAPREGGGGVGLVLGALAAVAGLAVLGITARERAATALAGVPLVSMRMDQCQLARHLGTSPIDLIERRWSMSRSPYDRGNTMEALAASVGWTRPVANQAERAVLIDALLEAGNPIGVAAQAFATDTPMLWSSSPQGWGDGLYEALPLAHAVHLYNSDMVDGLTELTETEAARLVGERMGFETRAFNVNRTSTNDVVMIAVSPRVGHPWWRRLDAKGKPVHVQEDE